MSQIQVDQVELAFRDRHSPPTSDCFTMSAACLAGLACSLQTSDGINRRLAVDRLGALRQAPLFATLANRRARRALRENGSTTGESHEME